MRPSRVGRSGARRARRAGPAVSRSREGAHARRPLAHLRARRAAAAAPSADDGRHVLGARRACRHSCSAALDERVQPRARPHARARRSRRARHRAAAEHDGVGVPARRRRAARGRPSRRRRRTTRASGVRRAHGRDQRPARPAASRCRAGRGPGRRAPCRRGPRRPASAGSTRPSPSTPDQVELGAVARGAAAGGERGRVLDGASPRCGGRSARLPASSPCTARLRASVAPEVKMTHSGVARPPARPPARGRRSSASAGAAAPLVQARRAAEAPRPGRAASPRARAGRAASAAAWSR